MDFSYKSEARHFQKKIRIAISQIFSQFSTSGPLTINYHLKHVVNRTFFVLFSDCYFTYSALYFSQIRSLFTRHIADQSTTTALEYVCIHFITLNMTRLVADTTFRLLTPFLSRTNSFAPWRRLLQMCAARTLPPSPRPPPPSPPGTRGAG